MPITIQIAQVILLISFLIAVYESLIRGGDVRMLGIAAVNFKQGDQRLAIIDTPLQA